MKPYLFGTFLVLLLANLLLLMCLDRHPNLPVGLRFSKAIADGSLVAEITNGTEDKYLAVKVSYKNKPTDKVKEEVLKIQPGETVKCDLFEGQQFVPGGSITLESSDYKKAFYRVPAL